MSASRSLIRPRRSFTAGSFRADDLFTASAPRCGSARAPVRCARCRSRATHASIWRLQDASRVINNHSTSGREQAMTDTGPLFVSSGDLIADRRYKWALDHAARGDLSGAAEILAQTVELAPRFATAWFALGAIRDRLGDRAAAVAAFEHARDADPGDYHGARLQLARLGVGDTHPAMTETYVRRLFDQYAGRYDAALTDHLNYRGPAILRGIVEAAMRENARPMRFGSMLDLGCGTGLGGAAFRCFAGRLVGVDLSPAMIAQADAKGFYDRLITASVADFLAEEAAAAAAYDLVLA